MKAALVLVLALAAPAAADSKTEQARGHFKQGKAFQDAGVYERAAEEYKLAYEADPRPEMLFNIAQAYRLAKQKQQALDYFKQYLEKQPSGAGADEARKHVVTLTKEIDEEAAAQQQEPPTTLAPEKPALVETTKLVDRGRGMRYAGIGIGAAGLVAVGLGIKFGLDARSASDDITNHMGPWITPDDKERFEEGERANRNMTIMYGVGGALVVTGAVLYYLGHRRRETPVLTYISTDGVGVQGQF